MIKQLDEAVVNIGTEIDNLTGVKFDKAFKEITYEDIRNVVREKLGDVRIHGWCDVTEYHDGTINSARLKMGYQPLDGSLKIKDLPLELKNLALKRQAEQGNKKDSSVFLGAVLFGGGFNWDETPEGFEFWKQIYRGNFEYQKGNNMFIVDLKKDQPKYVMHFDTACMCEVEYTRKGRPKHLIVRHTGATGLKVGQLLGVPGSSKSGNQILQNWKIPKVV